MRQSAFSPSRRAPFALPFMLAATLLHAGDAREGSEPPRLVVQEHAVAETIREPQEPLLVVFEADQRAILAARVGSAVTQVLKRLGEPVAAGEILVRLDETVFRAQVERMRALLRRAEIEQASKEQLFRDGTLSRAELETARAAAAVAASDLATAEYDLAGCEIKAPFAGYVAQVPVRQHEAVRAGQPLVEVIDDNRLRAAFLLPSRQLVAVREGQPVQIAVDETGATVTGILRRTGAVIDPVNATVRVEADVANADRSLRAGMRGRVDLARLLQDAAATADRSAQQNEDDGAATAEQP